MSAALPKFDILNCSGFPIGAVTILLFLAVGVEVPTIFFTGIFRSWFTIVDLRRES